MPPKTQEPVAKIVGFPINLQSLLQTAVLVISIISVVVYADRRLTTVERQQEFQKQILEEQKSLFKEMRDDQRRSLENQNYLKDQLRRRRED